MSKQRNQIQIDCSFVIASISYLWSSRNAEADGLVFLLILTQPLGANIHHSAFCLLFLQLYS